MRGSKLSDLEGGIRLAAFVGGGFFERSSMRTAGERLLGLAHLADVSVLGEVRKALAIAYATDVSIAARVGATAFDLRNVSAEERRTWNATT